MPAVGMPMPGGIDYLDFVELPHGCGEQGTDRRFALVEFVPEKDQQGLAALVAAARIALTASASSPA